MQTKEYAYCSRHSVRGKWEKQEEKLRALHPQAEFIYDTWEEGVSGLPSLLSRLEDGDRVYAISPDYLGPDTDSAGKAYLGITRKKAEIYFTDTPWLDITVAFDMYKADNPRVRFNMESFQLYVSRVFCVILRAYLDHAFQKNQQTDANRAEAIRRAGEEGHISGRKKGEKLLTAKFRENKDIILSQCRHFGGTKSDLEMIQITGLSRNTYYRYKKALQDMRYIRTNSSSFDGDKSDEEILNSTKLSAEDLQMLKKMILNQEKE